MYLFFALFCFPFQLLVCIPLLFGVEGTAEGLFWWMGVGEAFQTAGTEKMHRKAVHSRWLPPLPLYVKFRKDFALKSMLYPLICCECRIISKTQKHRQWIKISLLKKSNICLKKRGQRFSSKKKFVQAENSPSQTSHFLWTLKCTWTEVFILNKKYFCTQKAITLPLQLSSRLSLLPGQRTPTFIDTFGRSRKYVVFDIFSWNFYRGQIMN